MNEIKVFSPASIANLSCGYDILGACLDGIGDEITVRKTKNKELKITKIFGQKYFVINIWSKYVVKKSIVNK